MRALRCNRFVARHAQIRVRLGLRRRGPAAVRQQQLGRKLDDVFVATDEVESGYLRQLRAELRCFFKRVVLESDVPSALLNVDRYFNSAVMMTVVHDAAGRMDYHPHMRYQVRCSESARCDARA